MKLWVKIFERLSDSLNPIVVKELRQAVRGRFAEAVLMALPILQLLIIGMFLIMRSNTPTNFNAGREVFMVLLYILLSTGMLFVPAYTAVRLALERSDTNVDLLFITTLQPRAIIWGKFLAAMTLTVLIFSTYMPFMTFTYLLRGIDLPSIFVLLAFSFFIVATSIQLAIFIACISVNRIFKMLLGLGGLGILFTMFTMTIAGSYGLLGFGVGSLLDTWDFWMPACLAVIFDLIFIGLLFVLSVALITPPSANRALPVRLFMTMAWVVAGVATAIWSLIERNHNPMIGWNVISVGVFCIAFFVGVNERENLGRRVVRTIPRRWWARLLVFPFYSGAASGITWSFLMICLTLAIALQWSALFPALNGSGDLRESIEGMAGVGLYAFCYSISASLLRKWFFVNRVKPERTWVIALILIVIGSIVPFFIAYLFFLGDPWRPEDMGVWLVSSPFALGFKPYRPLYFTFVSGWAVIVAVLSLRWFIRQVRSFRPEALYE